VRIWTAVVGCLGGLTANVGAVDPEGRGQEPEARRLLDEIAQAYRALPAYVDEGTIQVSATRSKSVHAQTRKMSIALVRPNKLAVSTDDVRLVCDGDRWTTLVVPLKKYLVAPAPKKLTLAPIENSSLGAVVFSGPTGPTMSVLWELLLADDAAASLAQAAETLRREPDRDVSGRPHHVLRLGRADEPALRLYSDAETHLLSRIEVAFDPAELAKAGAETGLRELSVTWTAGPRSTQPPPAATFQFQAPDGASKVADLASRREAKEPRQDALSALVGKPAPEFTLTVLDGPDRTRQVTRSDLKGKVVVLDFWATWCGPCLEELPEIQKLVAQLTEAAAKDLLIVAVSQDNDAGDGADVRALVEKTLTARSITLAGGPLSAVALDPAKALGKSFHVNALPTLVLLDAQGTVQAVHVGFRPDIRDTLAQEIDSLRKGLSLQAPD
jgi:thiol-disulfide isomerase/thioredoxin